MFDFQNQKKGTVAATSIHNLSFWKSHSNTDKHRIQGFLKTNPIAIMIV